MGIIYNQSKGKHAGGKADDYSNQRDKDHRSIHRTGALGRDRIKKADPGR